MSVYIVLGDIMLDHNIEGTSTKIANEAPIPVILSNSESYRIGGCGNVAMNMLALGAKKIHLFSKVGDDGSNQKILRNLLPYQIEKHFTISYISPTTTKHRVYSDKKLMCRYDEEFYTETNYQDENHIVSSVKDILETTVIEAVVFSDYNKGYLTESLCQRVIQICNEYNVCTIVDPKVNYKKYMNCTIFKPNRNELKQIFNIDLKKLSLLDAHRQLHELTHCNISVITLAEKGISAYANGQHYTYQEDVKEVIDVTGAGDIVCSVLASHRNLDIHTVLRYASYYASVSISHIGAYVITPTDIQKLHTILSKQIKDDKVIFTNGCFDILHVGHITLFEFCRSLGATVIVGLNTDASIKRLKGPSRPINSLEDRTKMLQSISYISKVIPFDEDTPIKLLEYIKPDYLVKGGDYTKESVIGSEYAGEVVIFNYIDGKSTTNLIKQCQLL